PVDFHPGVAGGAGAAEGGDPGAALVDDPENLGDPRGRDQPRVVGGDLVDERTTGDAAHGGLEAAVLLVGGGELGGQLGGLGAARRAGGVMQFVERLIPGEGGT